MGGYGSGGHNKKKRIIEGFNSIDSFKDTEIPQYIEKEEVTAGIRKAVYYHCPICKRRTRYLYDIKDNYYFVCRKCLAANYSSQSLPRDEQAVRVAVQALENIGFDLTDMTPWDIMHIPLCEVMEKAGKKHLADYVKFYKSRDKWYDCIRQILKS